MITFRIFVAGPSDVKAERRAVADVVHRLLSDDDLSGRVHLEVIAWDGPVGSVPMLANTDPQDAITQALPQPCECDFVVMILWSRIGTPLPNHYAKELGLSQVTGTEWEYYNALQGANRLIGTKVLVYRNEAALPPDAPQGEQVAAFFAMLVEQKRSYNSYSGTPDFEKQLEHHLKVRIQCKLEASADQLTVSRWVTAPKLPFPDWTFTLLDDPTQDPARKAAVAAAVARLVTETKDIPEVLGISERLGTEVGGFEAAEALRLHYADLFPYMTRAQGQRAVAVFNSFAQSKSLTKEQSEAVGRAAARMESLLALLRQNPE